MSASRLTLLVAVMAMLMLSVACNSQQATVETADASVDDSKDLIAGLKAAGAVVEVTGTVSQPFFTPEGQVITVDGQDVQVFEYESEADAKAEADLVAPDGSSVGTSMMTWIATPHYYGSGQLIVLLYYM
jgi:hypothetical protein